VCWRRAATSGPVDVHVPLAGSYSSALARVAPPSLPPATSTFPLGSRVAEWSWRAARGDPVAAQVPLAGSYSSALRLPPPATRTQPLGNSVAE
jgi:hypothetical protein